VISGSLPPASLHGTWLENIEIRSIDDDTLYDLSSVTEIRLELRDPAGLSPELTLTKSGGQITIPSQGIIQWRAEVGQMQRLVPKLYDATLILQDSTDTVPLFIGTVSVTW